MLVFWLLLVGLVARILVAFWLTPSFDEFYYYLYSRHLAWSYFDHPVLIALTTGFGPIITGIVSPITIRLGNICLYTGSLYLLYLTGRKLFGEKEGRISLAIASIIPIFVIAFGILTLPDGPLIFFWSGSLYCAVWEFFPCQGKYRPSYRLACLGVLVGLACLSKYHGFILALGIWGFVLSSKEHRILFKSIWAWWAIGLFLLTLFPVWYWNWQHDWVSFTFHLSGRFQQDTPVKTLSFNFLNLLLVFAANFVYLFPSLGIPMHLSLLKVVKKWRLITAPEKLILWISLPLIVGFTILGGFQQVLAGWSMPGFWSITLLLGRDAAQWSISWVKKWLNYSLLAISVLLIIFLLHLQLGILQKPGQYSLWGGILPLETDTSTEMFDIRQLRRGFSQSPELLEALTEADFVFTNQWYLAGQISMAIAPLTSVPVTCFSDDMRGFAFWHDPGDWLGKDALYITIDSFASNQALNNSYKAYFADFQVIGSIPIVRGGEVIEVFHVYAAQKMLREYDTSLS